MNKENQSNTDERIRKLNEQYAEMQVELVRLSKENAELLNVTNKLVDKLAKLQKENAEQYKKTEKRVDEIVLQHKKSRKEINITEQVSSRTADQLTESEIWEAEVAAEISAEILEEDRKMIRETTDYTENIAKRFIGRILEKRFGADFMGWHKEISYSEAVYLDVDAWGASRSGTGAAYIVKIYLEFYDSHIESVFQQVEWFRHCQSDYKERAVYPMLAVMEISEEERRKVWNAGIHLFEIDDDDVSRYVEPPEDFEANGYHGAHGVERGVPHLQLVDGVDQKKQRGTE